MSQTKILITGGSGFIGTHLIESLLSKNNNCINLDIVSPERTNHRKVWRDCNILNKSYLSEIFSEFQPTTVIHLAAQTSTEGNSLDDYIDNTEGTANVLHVTQKTPSVGRIIITSSQHVRKPGSGLPQHDLDFDPHGFYGQSKVLTEQYTHQANLSCIWTIIRPTTVWGPYHPNLAAGLWNLMSKGLYIHPKNDPVIRSYGYVKNVVWFIEKILEAPETSVNKKMFYVGEEPIKQVEWIDAFSLALIGRKVPKVPRGFIYLLAKAGDLLKTIGMRFPMNSSRYFNLTTTNTVPVYPLIRQFGKPRYTIHEGIDETVSWLKSGAVQ